MAIKESCQYKLTGDLNNDCRADFTDVALILENWLIDCNLTLADPACVPE
jgi:hypothetical protein